MTVTKKDLSAGIGLAVLTTLIWSGNYVIARGISKQLPPVSLAFYRWSLATVCIAPLAIKKFMQQKQIVFANKSFIFWTAISGITVFNTLIYLAGHYTSAINLALLGTTSAPVFVILLAAIFLKEPVGRNRITGMLICIAGIIFLLSRGSLQQLSKFHFGRGDVLVLASAFSFAIYNTLVKKKPAAISPVVFLFVVFMLGTACLLPFYIYERIYSAPVKWTPDMVYIIVYLGIGNSIIAYFCWNASIEKLGASGTAIFSNLIPVFSTIEAVIFLGETFSINHLISGLLVIGGLIIANVPLKAAKLI